MSEIVELKLMLGLLKDDLKEIKIDVKETKEQTQKTNGRVNHHDDEFVHLHKSLLLMKEQHDNVEKEVEEEKKWRYMIIGGLIITNVLIIPPVAYIVTKLIDRVL